MRIITLILLIAGLVCFGLATLGVGGRINLVAAGLACWITTDLIEVIP
ncbi:hypothetical protein [Thermoactinospora rubra]|nr:hypothetical protein [Thermoactinospora rubra]